MSINLERLRSELNIMALAQDLGLEIGKKNARCFNYGTHKNNDKSYSLSFDTRRNRFKCFACDAGGSTIDLYVGVKGVEPKEAMHELWDMYFNSDGKPVKSAFVYRASPAKGLIDKKQLERETLIGKFSDIYEALLFWCRGVDGESMKYLTGPTRGLTSKTIEKFGLFTIRDYKACADFLSKGWSAEDLRMSGLVSENGNLIFYKHHLIIPFYQNKRVVFLQGRRLDNEHPKYLHLSGVEVPLFNVDTVKGRNKISPLYICEGAFDAMMMEQEGNNAVAVLGVNNFKTKQIEWCRQLNRPIKVMFDNDEAGKTAAEKIMLDLMFAGVESSLGEIPAEYNDVTDFYLARQKLRQ